MNRYRKIIRTVALYTGILFCFSKSSFSQDDRWISQEKLLDKIEGYWIGQCVGNYMGFPFEGTYEEEPVPVFIDRYYQYKDEPGLKINRRDLRGFCPIVTDWLEGAFSDDDTDIEFVTLHAIEKYGLDITYPEISEMWKSHINRKIWCANRTARDLMTVGYLPPATGSKAHNENWYQIDPQLVNEIWSMVYPGMVRQAVEKAEWGARITSDDWGTHPTRAYAAMYSAAIFESDVNVLVHRALDYLPDDSPFREGMLDVIRWHHQHPDWRTTRKLVFDKYYRYKNEKFTAPVSDVSALPNGLFGIMAILYGEGDFLKTTGIAVSAGLDCDNQAATCAGLIGVIQGASQIPEWLTHGLSGRKIWDKPFNDTYINFTRDGLPSWNRISEICQRILHQAEKAIVSEGGEIIREGGKVRYRIPANPGQSSEILWDTYGVPHVFSDSPEAMYHAFGWSQMHNHADLILKLYGQARGRASEYWGKEHIESDKRIHLFGIRDQAVTNTEKLEEPYRSFLSAFVRGMNDFAGEHPEGIGEAFRQVLPITETDVTAHVLRVMCLEFIAWEELQVNGPILPKGSNAYAIGPSRSASGNSMLVTNPHLPWYDFYLWFEAHLQSPGFNAYGITLVGAPTLSMAFNQNLGWAFTVNTMDGADTYRLKRVKEGYTWDGKIRSFDSKVQPIRIRQPDGTLHDSLFRFEYSAHGPVIRNEGENAYALRMVGAQNYRIFEQYHRMAAATDLTSFEEALRLLQNPMFNIIYADRTGNILYLFNGNVPIRPERDFSFWRGTIDGTSSKWLWNQILDYDQLPRLLNPSTGFIQNCNDAPWVCTWPPVLKSKDFPEWIAPKSMLLRPQRAVNMIKNDFQVSFDDLVDYKLNTGMEAADRFLDDLLAAVQKFPDTLATRAAKVLADWDRKTEITSRGGVLFASWMDKVDHHLFAKGWDPDQPVTTPDGLSDPKRAVDLLIQAASETMKKYGALDIAWGDVHRFRIGNTDLPANGGPAEYGIYRTIGYMEDAGSKKRAVTGDTYVAVTEFGSPVRAHVLLSYGNATQAGNPHCGDQLKLLSEKKLRPAWLDRATILEHLEKSERVSMKKDN